jgi:hypothetical protein
MRRAADSLGNWLLVAAVLSAVPGRGALDSNATDLPFDGKEVMEVVNDPFLPWVPMSMGFDVTFKESRVMDVCKNGKLIKTEFADRGGSLAETDEVGADGKITTIMAEHWPVQVPPQQVYEGGATLSQLPRPIPKELMRWVQTEGNLLNVWKSGGCQAYTGGILVTKDYRIYFCQLETMDTISVTSDGVKWRFLQYDSKQAAAAQVLSFRWFEDSDEEAGKKPAPASTFFPFGIKEDLTPPAPSDVACMSNYPPHVFGYSARYEVDEGTVLKFLKSGKKVKEGVMPFRHVAGGVEDFTPEVQATFPAGVSPGQEVEAQGVFVTKDYKIYVWMLHGDNALYLTDLKDDCWLTIGAVPTH